MTELKNPDFQKASDHWNKKSGPSYNWWSNDIVCRHINKLVCGVPIAGLSAGVVKLANDKAKQLNMSLTKGLSIGSGTGAKELALLRSGLVQHMTCYDLAEHRLMQGRQNAIRLGLIDRIDFRYGDAFEDFSFFKTRGEYDLVYWNNSLHHMPSTSVALEWSRVALAQGGLLVMDEYVGPNRIQYTDEMLEFANRVRSLLPPEKLIYPGDDTGFIDSTKALAKKPDLSRLIAKDPSEAADSENIIPSLKSFFPDATILPTGGAVYFCALPPLYANFDMNDPKDRDTLSILMLLDELYLAANPNNSLYAVALSVIH